MLADIHPRAERPENRHHSAPQQPPADPITAGRPLHRLENLAPIAELTDQGPPTAEHSLMPATLAGRRILPTAERLELLESSHTLHHLESATAEHSAEPLAGLHRSPSAERRHRLETVAPADPITAGRPSHISRSLPPREPRTDPSAA